MKSFMPFLWLIIIFLIVGIFLGFYIFSSQDANLGISKIVFIYLLLLVIFFGWLFTLLYKNMDTLSGKYGDMEKLMLDLRDGTKTFFKEKRQWPRVKDGISARLSQKESEEFMKVIDISYGGALLRMKKKPEPGQTIELYFYLPFFPQPIEAKVKIMRIFPAAEGEAGGFNVGVEFVGMIEPDRQKLIETVDLLKSSPNE